jgi:hypothetical protein
MMLRWYRTIATALLTALAAGLTVAGEGDALSQGKYKYSMQMSVTGYTGATLTDFPLLVVLSTSRTGFDYSQFKVADAGDLRFTDSSGVELAYELEKWDTSGTSYAWVKLPTLTSSTTLNAFWGNAADSVPAYRTDGSAWQDDFIGVWHMDAVDAADSTAFRNNGTGSGNTTTNGLVGDCQNFGGSASIDIGSITNDASGSTLSISALIRTTSGRGGAGDGLTLVSIGEDYQNFGTPFPMFGLGAGLTGAKVVNGVGDGDPCTYGPSGFNYETTGDTGGTTDISDDVWHQVAFVRSGSAGALYVDGLSKTNGISSGFDLSLDAFWHIGTTAKFAAKDFPLVGRVDEVRISRVARSANWMKASSDVIRNHESFLDYADVEVAAQLGSVFFGW